MKNREEVLKALECCSANNSCCFGEGCPYFWDEGNCENKLMKDAIKLIKKGCSADGRTENSAG